MRLDDCRTILRANPPLLRSFKLFLKALDLAMLRRDAETARFILGQWAPQHNVDFLPSRLGGLGSIKSYGELRIAKMPPDQQLSSYNKLLRLLWEIEQWMENSGLIPTQEVPSIDLKSLAHRLMPNTELVAAHLGTWHTTGQKVGAAIDRLVIPIRMPNQFTAGIVGVSKTHLYCMKLGVGSTFRVPDEFAYDRKLLESHLDPRNIAAIELAAVTYAENEFGGYNLLGGGLRVVVLAVYSNHNPLCRIAIRTGDSPSGIVRAIVAGKTHRACPGS